MSEYNRKAQQESVLEEFKRGDHFFSFQHELATANFESFTTENEDKDVSLKWFSSLEDLLQADKEQEKRGEEPPLTIFVMNEFMDALPTTVLRYTGEGWKEKVLKRSKDLQYCFL